MRQERETIPNQPDPTPEEIRVACEEIRKEWPEWRLRSGKAIPVDYDRPVRINTEED